MREQYQSFLPECRKCYDRIEQLVAKRINEIETKKKNALRTLVTSGESDRRIADYEKKLAMKPKRFKIEVVGFDDEPGQLMNNRRHQTGNNPERKVRNMIDGEQVREDLKDGNKKIAKNRVDRESSNSSSQDEKNEANKVQGSEPKGSTKQSNKKIKTKEKVTIREEEVSVKQVKEKKKKQKPEGNQKNTKKSGHKLGEEKNEKKEVNNQKAVEKRPENQIPGAIENFPSEEDLEKVKNLTIREAIRKLLDRDVTTRWNSQQIQHLLQHQVYGNLYTDICPHLRQLKKGIKLLYVCQMEEPNLTNIMTYPLHVNVDKLAFELRHLQNLEYLTLEFYHSLDDSQIFNCLVDSINSLQKMKSVRVLCHKTSCNVINIKENWGSKLRPGIEFKAQTPQQDS